jgi:cobalt/nickel transport system permease protein
MHIPDGFIGPGASALAGIGAAGGFAVALRQARNYLTDRLIPLAALVAAFVFAAQMVNFPVLPGMSGHLIGGVLAAVLLGPSAAFVVITIVIIVQAFVFADGGITALGLNVLNMAGVAAVGGYFIYRALLRFTNGSQRAVSLTAGIAAFVSIPLTASAFALEFAVAGTASSVSVTSVLIALVGVQSLIGIGEGVITALIVSAVVRSRPDLVYGAPDFRGDRTETLLA